jgi:pimeloyl-ACP methyl ester carboxylesterase
LRRKNLVPEILLLPLLRRIPALGTRTLTRIFLTPQRRAPELRLGSAVQQLALKLSDQTITCGVWGRGPLVVLVHGWAGGGHQFEPLRDSLVQAGFSVALFDAPAHGGAAGRRSNAVQFARCVELIAETLGPPRVVVGHSLGGLACALTQRGPSAAQGVVLCAPLPSLDFALSSFQTAASLTPLERERVAQRVEQLAGIERSRASLSDALQHTPPTLLFHDVNDRSIDVENSRAFARTRPNLKYVETTGLGHNRILLDPGVHSEIVRFVIDLETGSPLRV